MVDSFFDVETHKGYIPVSQALLPSSLQQRIAIYSGHRSLKGSTPIIDQPAETSHSTPLEGFRKQAAGYGEDHSRNDDFHSVLEQQRLLACRLQAEVSSGM
jgi:hypothetical protein